MKKYFYYFMWLLCLLSLGQHGYGQLVATTETKYTSLNAKTDGVKYSDMEYLDFGSLFKLNADLTGGIIGDITSGGEIKLEVFSFDDTKANGKGVLVYGVYIDATSTNYMSKTWEKNVYVNYVEPPGPGGLGFWEIKHVTSNNIKKLVQESGANIYIPGNQQTCKEYDISLRNAYLTYSNLFIRAVTFGTDWWNTPLDCKKYYEPAQPVIIEATVRNATFRKFKVPGIGERDAAGFFKLHEAIHFFKTPEHFPATAVMVNTHRGVWMDTGENSRTAFQAAVDNGFNMIEMDVLQSSDDTLFMIHDFELSRLTNSDIYADAQASKLYITDLNTIQQMYPGYSTQAYIFKYGANRPWSELQQLKLRDRRGHVIPDEGLIRFSEVLDMLKDKILLDVDKVDDYFPKVWEVVKAKGMQRQVAFKGSANKWTPKRLEEVFGADAPQVMFSPQYFYETQPFVQDAGSQETSITPVAATNANFKTSIDMWLQAHAAGRIQVHSFQFFPEIYTGTDPNNPSQTLHDPLLYPVDLSKYILNESGSWGAHNIINEKKHVWQAEMPVDCFTGQNSSLNRVFYQDVKMRKKMTVDQVLESNATIIDTDRPLQRREYLKKRGYKVY